MDLTNITTTHNGEQVVDGLGLCKAIAKATGMDPMRAWLLVGGTANASGFEVLAVGPKGDQSAYRLGEAQALADHLVAMGA